MGMLKRMKDMKDMVDAAPGMMQQAQQMAAQAQQYAAAQQAAAQAQMAQMGQTGPTGGMAGVPGAAPSGPDFDPISGVTLEQFAAVSKGAAAFNYDQTKLPEIAASRGISSFDWEEASRGWNERIKVNPAVAQRFNQLYRES